MATLCQGITKKGTKCTKKGSRQVGDAMYCHLHADAASNVESGTDAAPGESPAVSPRVAHPKAAKSDKMQSPDKYLTATQLFDQLDEITKKLQTLDIGVASVNAVFRAVPKAIVDRFVVAGGKVQSSPTSKTTIMVYGKNGQKYRGYTKAIESGIETVSVEEFARRYPFLFATC